MFGLGNYQKPQFSLNVDDIEGAKPKSFQRHCYGQYKAQQSPLVNQHVPIIVPAAKQQYNPLTGEPIAYNQEIFKQIRALPSQSTQNIFQVQNLKQNPEIFSNQNRQQISYSNNSQLFRGSGAVPSRDHSLQDRQRLRLQEVATLDSSVEGQVQSQNQQIDANQGKNNHQLGKQEKEQQKDILSEFQNQFQDQQKQDKHVLQEFLNQNSQPQITSQKQERDILTEFQQQTKQQNQQLNEKPQPRILQNDSSPNLHSFGQRKVGNGYNYISGEFGSNWEQEKAAFFNQRQNPSLQFENKKKSIENGSQLIQKPGETNFIAGRQNLYVDRYEKPRYKPVYEYNNIGNTPSQYQQPQQGVQWYGSKALKNLDNLKIY